MGLKLLAVPMNEEEILFKAVWLWQEIVEREGSRGSGGGDSAKVGNPAGASSDDKCVNDGIRFISSRCC